MQSIPSEGLRPDRDAGRAVAHQCDGEQPCIRDPVGTPDSAASQLTDCSTRYGTGCGAPICEFYGHPR